MEQIIDWIKDHWMQIGVILLAAQNALKGIRDTLDKTPDTDDNFFEKFVTVSGKVVAYLFLGKRPN